MNGCGGCRRDTGSQQCNTGCAQAVDDSKGQAGGMGRLIGGRGSAFWQAHNVLSLRKFLFAH